MKKIILLLLMMLALVLGTAYSQEDGSDAEDSEVNEDTNEKPTFLIKTETLSLIVDPIVSSGGIIPINLSLETKLGKKKNGAILANLDYIILTNFPNITSFQLGIGGSWHFLDLPYWDGLYASVELAYSSVSFGSIINTEYNASSGFMVANATVGYQLILPKKFVVEAFLGVGVSIGLSNTEQDTIFDVPYGIFIGYPF